MARRGQDPKVAALRADRSLNPRPEDVVDEGFGSSEFFDARDLVQVKYEMVRRVRVDGEPVSHCAAAFGFSRPSFYQAAAAVDADGLAGLVPARPGPRRAHKLTGQIVAFARETREARPGAAGGGSGRADRRAVRGVGAPTLGGAGAGPGEGSQKPGPTMSRTAGNGTAAMAATWPAMNCSAAGRWPGTRAGGAAGWRYCSTAAWWPGCMPGTQSPSSRRARRRAARPPRFPRPRSRTGSSRPSPRWRWRPWPGGEPR